MFQVLTLGILGFKKPNIEPRALSILTRLFLLFPSIHSQKIMSIFQQTKKLDYKSFLETSKGLCEKVMKYI